MLPDGILKFSQNSKKSAQKGVSKARFARFFDKMRLFCMIFKHCEILSISVVCRLVGQRKGIDYASAVMSIDILFSSFLLFVIELERPRESYIRNSPISVARQLRQEECFPPPSRISNGRGKSCFCFSLQFCWHLCMTQ